MLRALTYDYWYKPLLFSITILMRLRLISAVLKVIIIKP